MRFIVKRNSIISIHKDPAPCDDAELRRIEVVADKNTILEMWTVNFPSFDFLERFIVKNGPVVIREEPDGGFYDIEEEDYLLSMELKRKLVAIEEAKE